MLAREYNLTTLSNRLALFYGLPDLRAESIEVAHPGRVVVSSTTFESGGSPCCPPVWNVEIGA